MNFFMIYSYESVITNSPEPSNGNVVFYRLSTSAASIFLHTFQTVCLRTKNDLLFFDTKNRKSCKNLQNAF